MYLEDFVKKINSKIIMYVDMDGVIADYEVGVAKNFDRKRPLYTSLEKLEILSKKYEIEMHILSVARFKNGIKEKNDWLDRYASFFENDNRHILSRELNDMKNAKTLKLEFLSKLVMNKDYKYIIIDDDPAILREIMEMKKDFILLKDTCLVD